LPFIQVCSEQALKNCSTVQGKLQSPLLSQLCKPGSQQALCHCSYTCGDLPFIQVCSEQALKNCSTVQGKSHSPLLSAALENRLTAGCVSLQLHLKICHSYRCSVSKHSKTAALFRANRIPHCSVRSATRLTAGTGSLQLHQWRFAIHTFVQ